VVATVYREAKKLLFRRSHTETEAEQMNTEHWIRKWRDSFSRLGVEVVVADVGQSCVVVDLPARTIILSPSLKLTTAEKILQKFYQWWQHQPTGVQRQLCSFLSC